MNDTLYMIIIFLFAFVIFFWLIKNRKKINQFGNVHKNISETKCTCQACGNIWYYGKREEIQNKAERISNLGKSMSNSGSDMMCCGGCLPAAFLPREKITPIKDLNKCPKCNSQAIKKEIVTHQV